MRGDLVWGRGESRATRKQFPAGMTERKASAKAMRRAFPLQGQDDGEKQTTATARATAKARARARAIQGSVRYAQDDESWGRASRSNCKSKSKGKSKGNCKGKSRGRYRCR